MRLSFVNDKIVVDKSLNIDTVTKMNLPFRINIVQRPSFIEYTRVVGLERFILRDMDGFG